MSTRIESADNCIIINGVLYPKGVLRACIEGNLLNVWEDMERTIPLINSVPFSDIIHVNSGAAFTNINALTDFVKEHFFKKRIKNISELINDVGYLTSETDPTVPGHVKAITASNISHWNTAYGWGNHAGLYPLLSGSYDNPTWINSLAWSKITGKPTSLSGYGITDAYTKTQINNFFSGAAAITGYNKANWDAAYATSLNAFVKGGNSFGANAILGTNDNFYLHFKTNNIVRGGFGSSVVNGNFFLGSCALSIASFYNNSPITGGTSAYGNYTNATIQSDVTTQTFGYRTIIGTQAASFNTSALYHYSAGQGSIGAGSSIANQYGFIAEANLVGATNNYGFYGNIQAGTGRYNLFMAGTANNYLAGTTLVGSTTDNGIDKLQVTGSISSSSSLRLQSDHFFSAPAYHYSTGILITTDILASVSTMFELYITGNSYTNTLPINTQLQGYMYSVTPELLQCKGINYGQPISSVDVFADANNFVCFWLNQTSASNILRFRLSTRTNTGRRITSITNVARPDASTQIESYVELDI